MSFLRKRSRSQCSSSFGDDQTMAPRIELRDADRKSRSDTIYSARTSCSEADVSDFAVQDSCVARNFPKQKSSHLRFLAWVAYTRRFTEEWISEDERRTCPLLWCRTVFKDQEAMLRHVWNCEHLSKGLYWCFHCQKPERVGKSQCRRCQGLPTKADRVASVAKRIFSKLGAKPYRHEHLASGFDVGKTLSSVSEALATSSFPDEKRPFEEAGPINWVQQDPQELPNSTVMSEMPGDWTAASVELPDSPIAELVGTECPIELGSGTETWTDNFYAENLEEWDEPLPTSSKGRGRSPKLALDTSVPPVLPSFYSKPMPIVNPNWVEIPSDEVVISPLSPTGGTTGFDLSTLDISPTDSETSNNSFFTDSGYSSATSIWSFSVNGLSRNSSVESKKGKEIPKLNQIPEIWAPQPVHARPVTLPDLPNNLEDLSRRPSNASYASHASHYSERHHQAETSQLAGTSSSALLQSFARVLDEHIKHTRTALEEMEPSAIIMELLAMSRSSMVSIGLDVLADILEGRHPTAIVQVFAFTHVACAAAIAIDGENAKVYTPTWFRDSLTWIPERQRPLYLQIAKFIWAPSGQPDMGQLSFTNGFSNPQNLVVNSCKDFLHFFEHYQILENQPSLNVDRMLPEPIFDRNVKNHVIDELIKMPSFEGFINDVVDVERRFASGKITSTRALELELICAGKLASQSDSIYGRFQEHVMRLCNPLYQTNTGIGQSRMSYYIKDISSIKHLIPEEIHQENRQHEEHVEVPATQSEEDDDDLFKTFDFESFERDETFPFAPEIHMPVSITSIPSEHEPASLPHDSTLPYYSNQQTPVVSESSTPHLSPGPFQPPQFSAQSTQEPSASSSMAPPSYRCHCGYVPTGEEKWKASNLRRHKRTQHPVEVKVYPCPFPGCTSQFSRSDNLRDHQRRKNHEVRMGMGGGSGSGQGSKRRKVGESGRTR